MGKVRRDTREGLRGGHHVRAAPAPARALARSSPGDGRRHRGDGEEAGGRDTAARGAWSARARGPRGDPRPAATPAAVVPAHATTGVRSGITAGVGDRGAPANGPLQRPRALPAREPGRGIPAGRDAAREAALPRDRSPPSYTGSPFPLQDYFEIRARHASPLRTPDGDQASRPRTPDGDEIRARHASPLRTPDGDQASRLQPPRPDTAPPLQTRALDDAWLYPGFNEDLTNQPYLRRTADVSDTRRRLPGVSSHRAPIFAAQSVGATSWPPGKAGCDNVPVSSATRSTLAPHCPARGSNQVKR